MQKPIRNSGNIFRQFQISGLAVVLAAASAVIARALIALIDLVTNISFHGKFSLSASSPWDHSLGVAVIAVPVIGGLIVGVMARYGSPAIRGHGIPEAMEQILLNQSKIPARLIFLKPISSAISIGTGGPFGAEGPIIATGGSLGSYFGQFFKLTPHETKTLLAAGAAAGMTSIFGTPLSAVLLAIELLLFEFRAQSFIPVAIACTAAAALRNWYIGPVPFMDMPVVQTAQLGEILLYFVIGSLVGIAAIFITKAVYWIEDRFEHLPVHWMWWPAIGAVVVGIIGYFYPRTLGVGYANLDDMLSGKFAGTALAMFCALKFVSWAISLASGTSGGTLAPLFTIGGGIGAILGGFFNVDARMASLVGMAAIFAGASRAFLASIVFAYEATKRPETLVPLLAACTAAYLFSTLFMKNTIMTEKIARRGTQVPGEYHPDIFGIIAVSRYATLNKDSATDSALAILMQRKVTIMKSQTLAEASHLMHEHRTERLPVVADDDPSKVIGVICTHDLLRAYQEARHR